jgi:hypothetical protein
MQGARVFKHMVKPSLRFAVMLFLLHIMAASVVSATAIPLAAKLVLFLLLALGFMHYLLRDILLLLGNSWREISLDRGYVSVVTGDGSGFLGRIENNSVVSPYFVVLCVRAAGHRLRAFRVIFPDAMGNGAFREFCVQLKLA